MHNMPGIPVGHFAIRPGAMMAAADTIDITVTGKGGHAAKPHDCVDTTVVAAHIIVALQTIASRNVDPAETGRRVGLHGRDGPTAHNVIPQVVKMKGTVRTMDPAVQDMVEARIAEIVAGTAMALGREAEVDYQRGYPVTMNTPENTAFAAEVAARRFGPGGCRTPPLMGAEDFSYMLIERPGAYIFLGNGDTAMVHHPAYNFDDNAIPFGVKLVCRHGRGADAGGLTGAANFLRKFRGGGACPPRSVVAELGRLAAEHGIGQRRIDEDHRQHDDHADQDDPQAFRRAGGLVDRHAVGHDIGIEAE